MPYILRDANGEINAVSVSDSALPGWESLDAGSAEYVSYLEKAINKENTFRESDIQLARVLEDLIELLIYRDVIHFTDFPVAAQKRLNYRQNLRRHAQALNIIVEDDGLM